MTSNEPTQQRGALSTLASYMLTDALKKKRWINLESVTHA